MKKLFLLLILLLSLYIPENYAQMPPHPDLLEKINSGKVSVPFILSNIDLIKSKGVDAPWAAPELQQKVKLKTFSRTLGPNLVPSGSWKALAILVKFSDKASQVNASYFDNLLFGQSTGTLRDYYSKVSYGNLDVVTVNLPSAIGWVTAPQTYAYYVNGLNGTGSYPQNSQKLVEDVVNQVNSQIDFSQYDNDGDGYVDALFIIHSGPGAEYTGSNDDIWSHAWVTSSPQNLDGVNVYRYSIEPEYWLNPGDMTCGVFAHEMGHAVFGLPDLYDRDYTSYGLGDWSIMAGGGWNGTLGNSPAFPDAWSHSQMGYINPTVVSSNISNQTIHNVENTPEAFLLWNDLTGSEYFLVENRQQTNYDTYLPGNGLCIYHIDNSVFTQNDKEWYPGHTSSGNYLIALEQADGLWQLEHKSNQGNTGDSYPGSTDNRNFGNSTIPDSKKYNLSETGIGVSNISSSSSIMTADLKVDTQIPLPQFSEQTLISLISLMSASAAWGDYDNDGDLDILLVGVTEDWTSIVSKIYRNNGNNTFTDQTTISITGVRSGSAAWGDYDNDGYLDILLTGYNDESSPVSKIYHNNGNNTFAEQTLISLIGVGSSSASWGDYDNDGDLDILLTGYNDENNPVSKIYHNNGNNTFTEQTLISLIDVRSSSTSWGDYDNDGDLDILLTGLDGTSSRVSKIYRNNGNNSFTEQTSISLTGVYVGSASWGDYDNDSDLDILLTGEAATRVSKIYRNDGNTFTEQTISLTGVRYGSATWGDYDNDGDLDILLCGNTGSNYVSKIYRNDGNNTFTIQTLIYLTGGNLVAWGDYDNDGDLDILLCGNTGNSYVSKIYRNNNTGPNTPPASPPNLQAAVTGNDVTFSWEKSSDNQTPQNGLHYNLVIGTTPNGVNTLSPMSDRETGFRKVVRLGNSQTNSWTIKGLADGQYYWSVQAIDNAFAGSDFASTKSFTIGSVFTQFSEQTDISLPGVGGGSAAWGDYDNDDDLDILLTGRDSDGNYISKIYRNDGTFTEQTDIFLSGFRKGYWGDYDNDGYLDMLLTGATESEIYRNNSNNTFTEQTSISLPGFANIAAWGDYDNDGYLDILLGNKIYHNNRDNSFTQQIQLSPANLSVVSAAWGDYDNDGDVDILLSGQYFEGYHLYQLTTIYHNNGNNTFTDLYSTVHLISGESAVAWGDYDNDGDLDVLIVGSGNFKIYRNDGNNLFSEISIPLGIGNCSVAWGDYDNDGDLDILITGVVNEPISKIYRNDGGDTFTEQTSIFLIGVSGQVAWGDYDNDGDLDILLTGSTGNGYVSKIYRNNNTTPNTPPAAPSNLQAVINGNDVTFSWDKSTDAETPLNGLHYNLVIGITPDGVDKLSPMSNRSTGFRRVVRLGNSQTNNWTIKNNLLVGHYYWSVQAIDNCFAGSEFASDQDIPLPVELTSFTAERMNKFIKLNWQTATELNNYGFEIERNQVGVEGKKTIWSKIGFVEGNGNSNSPKEYSFIDKKLFDGGTKFYYRLKQIDLDGSFEYSDEISAEVDLIPDELTLYQNYPNPFNPSTVIRYGLPSDADVILIVYDVLGNEIKKLVNEKKNAGTYEITFDAVNLSNGIYFYKLQAGESVQTRKMILLK